MLKDDSAYRLEKKLKGGSRAEESPLTRLFIKVRFCVHFEMVLTGFVGWLDVRCERSQE